MLKAQTRLTTQRKVIFEELSKVCSHPTADEIYNIVRLKLPNISLGTVYRNLELLAETKQIQKIESGTTRRFDANLTDHDHVRCIYCGNVGDVFDTLPKDNISSKLENGYNVLSMRVEYDGICPECQNSHD